MKKLLLFFAIAIAIAIAVFGFSNINAQENLFSYDYLNVPADEMEVFMANEAMYWSKIHAVLLKKGKVTGWTVSRRVGGLESEPNVYFYLGIGSYENLDNLYYDWPQAEKEVRSAMDKEKLTLIDERLKQNKFRVGNVMLNRGSFAGSNQNEWSFLVHNYAQATNVGDFLEAQDKYFKPFFEENIKNKNTKQVFWLTAAVLSPTGYGYNWNCYTADAYKNLSDIYNAWNNETTYPEDGMTEVNNLMKNQAFYKRVIWRKVMTLDAEGNLIKN